MLNWKVKKFTAADQEREYFIANVAGLECEVSDNGIGWCSSVAIPNSQDTIEYRKARSAAAGKKWCENRLKKMAKEITEALS